MNPDFDGSDTPENQPPTQKRGWALYVGLTALGLAVLLPLMALAIPFLGLPPAVSTALVTGFIVGAPEILILIAASLLGKKAVHYFTNRLKRSVSNAAIGTPASKARYYAGLAIALVSTVPLYLTGYFPNSMPQGNARTYFLVGADLAFILAVLIMGGEFWSKVRRVFIWDGNFHGTY
ncbi:hypothetical protein ACIGBH_39645 [Streptomyces sp. NPDC085929]|uniref:hypothetical protein n=1 Tax=Streptomyces sp. NPDC085929 TaxID=3365739 RepID=UPI0037CD2544